MAASCVECLLLWVCGGAVGAFVLVSVLGNACLKAGQALLVVWTVSQLLRGALELEAATLIRGVATGIATNS